MMRHWVRDARCASKDIDIDPKEFQRPLRGNSQANAKLVCMDCPVQLQCLSWALNNKEVWGVWGGLDEAEIRKTLSVDSWGRTIPRCRPPGCPNPRCRARPNLLAVELAGRKSRLTCTMCGFAWTSQSSAQAVTRFLRTRQVRKLRTAAARTRLPFDNGD